MIMETATILSILSVINGILMLIAIVNSDWVIAIYFNVSFLGYWVIAQLYKKGQTI